MGKFTEEDLRACWGTYPSLNHFVDILNGECSVEETRNDVKSLIGTKYDERIKHEE